MENSLADRFWSKVHKGAGCWEWTGSKNSKGYGRFHVDGKLRRAHRVAVFLTAGAWPPEELQVCHHCDNPGCVRPDHLFIGTNRDNVIDKVRKGRHPYLPIRNSHLAKGERHGNAKLTEAIVRTIRGSSEGNSPLASRYGVTRNLISMVRNRRCWRHVP